MDFGSVPRVYVKEAGSNLYYRNQMWHVLEVVGVEIGVASGSNSL